MSTKYTLNVTNNTTQTGDFMVFQESPDANVSNVRTLAWLAMTAHPTADLEFQWSLDYSFVWTKTTDLKPGTVVNTGQTWAANLDTSNQITLDEHSEDAYTFSDQSQGLSDGTLQIVQANSVQSGDVSVGIGMSGKAAFLVEARPNAKVIMTPKEKPTYWLVHGDYQEGQVLDTNEVAKNACRIEFDETQSMEVSLNHDNTWSIG